MTCSMMYSAHIRAVGLVLLGVVTIKINSEFP